jgi:hypothetical protein
MPTPWQPLEHELLQDMYPHCHTDDVAAWLGRSTKSVYEHAKWSGLKKTAEYLASNAAGRFQSGRMSERMVANHFRKGMAPWNKGKTWDAGGRSVQTRFQKGHVNAWKRVPIGTLRVTKDGTLQQKLTNEPGPYHKRWFAVHRIVWERECGPIPEGYMVRFKQGMRTVRLEEITVDRLECITQAENAIKNHPKNTSPELAKLYQLRGAITRQVNRIAKEKANV